MNAALWVLQGVFALHTLVGAGWKLSNSEQRVPSLGAIPHRVWLAMIGFELVVGLGLIVPAFIKPVTMLVPIAAACIAVEMLAFIGLHFASGNQEHGQVIYWLVVAALCAFLAYGRFALSPL